MTTKEHVDMFFQLFYDSHECFWNYKDRSKAKAHLTFMHEQAINIVHFASSYGMGKDEDFINEFQWIGHAYDLCSKHNSQENKVT